MNNEQNQKQGYLDIIYEGRNKTYGSYELRRNYTKRMRNALISTMVAMTLITGGFVFSGFISKDVPKKPYINITCDLSKVKVDHEIKPLVIPPPPPPKPVSTKRFTVPVVAKNDDVPETEKPPAQTDMHNATPGQTNNTNSNTDIGPAIQPPGGNGTGPVAPKKTDMPIIVDQPPVPGYDLVAYLAENLHYPDRARETNVSGRVVLKFVVNEDGAISDVEVVHGIGAGCDEEAIRVVKAMPRWKPGKQNGIPVKVYFNQPITFKLE